MPATSPAHPSSTSGSGPRYAANPALRSSPAAPQSPAMGRGAHLLMSGEPAMRVVAEILPTARPITVPSGAFGNVELRPGSVFSDNRMLIHANWTEVYSTIDDRLYQMGTQAFLRDEWLNAMSAGARRATWLAPIIEAEIALLSEIIVPSYLLLGLSCAKSTVIFSNHRAELEIIWEHGPKALAALQQLRRDHATFFSTIIRKIIHDVAVNLPKGVRGEDVGFLIGRVIKGVDGLPEVTLGAMAKTAAKVTPLVTLTHLPAVAAHAGEAAAQERAELFREHLRQFGHTVTPGEAKAIIEDATRNRSLEETLNQLETACKALAPSLQKLQRALYE